MTYGGSCGGGGGKECTAATWEAEKYLLRSTKWNPDWELCGLSRGSVPWTGGSASEPHSHQYVRHTWLQPVLTREVRVKFRMRARAFGNRTPSPRGTVNHRPLAAPQQDWVKQSRPAGFFYLIRRQSLAFNHGCSCRHASAGARSSFSRKLGGAREHRSVTMNTWRGLEGRRYQYLQCWKQRWSRGGLLKPDKCRRMKQTGERSAETKEATPRDTPVCSKTNEPAFLWSP